MSFVTDAMVVPVADSVPLPPTHRSIRFRFTASLLINVGRAGMSFVAGIVVARALGPLDYGTMTFLIGSFTAISTLMDMGSANAFFTFISQRPRDRRFVVGYLAWQALQFTVVFGLVAVLLPQRWIDTLWVGHPRSLVAAALVAFALQQQVWQTFNQIGFSLRETYVQLTGFVVVACHFALAVLGWWLGLLDVWTVLVLVSVEYFVAITFVWVRLSHRFPDTGRRVDAAKMVREYWAYCSPIIVYCWFGFFYTFADNWMLQRFGGGRQQGYYAVATQFSTISMFATVSMLQIFWKEVAEAHAKGDTLLVERLFKRVSRLLYAVAAAVAGFLIPWSSDLVRLTLGPNYAAGVPILQVMLLYPLHQTMGQVSSTMFFATAQTKVQVRIGIVSSMLTIPLSYFVLAPADGVVPGLGLGGFGSALKLVATTIITVNAISWWFCRLHGWKFDWAYQLQAPVAAAVAGLLSYGVGRAVIWEAPSAVFAGIAVALVCYLASVAALVWRFPDVVGITRADLDHLFSRRNLLNRLW